MIKVDLKNRRIVYLSADINAKDALITHQRERIAELEKEIRRLNKFWAGFEEHDNQLLLARNKTIDDLETENQVLMGRIEAINEECRKIPGYIMSNTCLLGRALDAEKRVAELESSAHAQKDNRVIAARKMLENFVSIGDDSHRAHSLNLIKYNVEMSRDLDAKKKLLGNIHKVLEQIPGAIQGDIICLRNCDDWIKCRRQDDNGLPGLKVKANVYDALFQVVSDRCGEICLLLGEGSMSFDEMFDKLIDLAFNPKDAVFMARQDK